ncbi:MAG: hypothetical protein F6K17_05145, partial [Okeania sp. SIO3C4]|nr:hypothetical protein [Okeania sp. SIO3C4]
SQLETSIGNVNQQIETNLNKEELVKKIGDFLDKVTAILDGEAVKNALSTAENGIQTITTNLDKVTLEPAFQMVVNKSGDIETQLKAIDVSKLSTPSKAALKVGTEVIKQVDVPGIVTPELQAAFAEILEPLDNIIGLIQGEFQKIDNKIVSFTPGNLVKEFLSPYLNPVIDKLEEYKPSVLLEPVKDFYNGLLEKMEVINPNQLLEKLEELYLKLVNVIESLSPKKITDFLTAQLSNIQKQLDDLPVETLVQKIKDGLGEIDKVMASLGLEDVLKSDFWQTLKDILNFSFTDKIKEIETIRDKVAEKVGDVDGTKLTQELDGLKQAIATYIDNPNTATDISTVTTANTNYQNEINNLLNSAEELKDITPPAAVTVDYNDLKKRLENLYQDFTAARPELPQQTFQELETIVQNKQQDLEGNQTLKNQLKTKSNEILTSQLIEDFKNVIPNEIDRQITNPIKEILAKLDKILVQPRAILSDIEEVIKKIAAAPGEIAEILVRVTDSLAKKIREAIDSLKQVITELTTGVVTLLQDTYQIIVKTVKSLNPRRLLHIFDESDFENLDLLIQKINQPAADDQVSKYINSKLSPNTKSLLVDSKSDATKRAVINDLNDILLTDANFYNSQRFESIKLTAQGEELRQKTDRNESEIIFFNRLLLEAYYNTPNSRIIKMNIESIFPYLKQKLAEIYPQEVVNKLDELHQKIIQLLRDIPTAIGEALDQTYKEKIVAKTEELRKQINNLFKALRAKLEALKSELDIGLEDVGDAFDRLINAIPV